MKRVVASSVGVALSFAAAGGLALSPWQVAHADRVDHFIAQLQATGFKVRLQAAYILGTLKDRRAVPSLVAALKDVHYAVRGAAAVALGNIGDGRGSDALIVTLSDDESWVRAEAVRALSRLRSTAALPHLVRLLEDADAKVRLEAVVGLGRTGDRRAVDALAKILEGGIESGEMIEAAKRSLGKLRSVIDVDEQIRLLRRSADKHRRARAAVVLGSLGERRAVPALVDALADKESYVRSVAALALANIGDARALEPLQKLLEREDNARVRNVAHLCLQILRKKVAGAN